jgi:release factor glutamine methyltransferase
MSGDSMNVAQAVQHCVALGLTRLDAQLLVLHVLGRPAHDRAWLLAHDTDGMPPHAQTALSTLAARRAAGEPLAYLTGHKEFFGLDLQVDARVLDPRADTETLVEWALDVLPETKPARVIDLGTGSGAIALAIKATRPLLAVTAVDFSLDALSVALGNAQRLGLDVQFQQGSWLSEVNGHFDAIVSNPPYIASQDEHLAALQHEPLQALASGADGLDDIRTIVRQAPAHLTSGGWLLLEHGYDQAEAVLSLLSAAGFSNVQSRQDLAGIERCSGGRWDRTDEK